MTQLIDYSLSAAAPVPFSGHTRGGIFCLQRFVDFASCSTNARYVRFGVLGQTRAENLFGRRFEFPMNAICVRCGRPVKYRLIRGCRVRGALCQCGGVIVKARIADLFEFPTRYEPVNPIAREKLARALSQTLKGAV